jgi:hypothetical protein
MAKVFCFKHPQYSGAEAPVLSCKTCCGIFVAVVKEQAQKMTAPAADLNLSNMNINEWFDSKRKQSNATRQQSNWKPGFNPETI